MKNLIIWIGAAIVSVVLLLTALSLVETPPPGQTTRSVDRIVVTKSRHEMSLLRRGKVVKTYRVALGRGGLGAKSMQGDNKVPEGIYAITGRNAHSAFHLSLRIGYPTSAQKREAQKMGVDPGGDVMIHGIRNGLGWLGPMHRAVDWTRGCIAVDDGEIEEVWGLVPNGTVIEIRK